MNTPQSQQELRKQVYAVATSYTAAGVSWHDGKNPTTLTDRIMSLITAHDKKLLAEVRERVIGEDEYVKDFSSIAQESIEPAMRNELREQERKQLDAIEKSL